MTPELRKHFEHLRGLIDGYLPKALGFAEESPRRLRDAMAYSLLAPGKRLRPILTMLACEVSDGRPEMALPGAAAAEMIHCYSLVHDDLPAMDDDDLRRGRPTCHKQFDEATAILAGDALLTLAFEVLAREYPAATAGQCCRALATCAGANGMVGGQMLDLEAEASASSLDADALERIHRLKTGALFRACVRIGWQVSPNRGSSRETTLARLEDYVANFGLAFQITDDLLDVQGNLVTTGKAVGKDAARGKLTYPGLLGVEESRRRADDMVARAVEAVAPFGDKGRTLAALAESILGRVT